VQRKVFFALFSLAILAGGWFFLKSFKFEGLEGLGLGPREGGGGFFGSPSDESDSLRLASFNLKAFGETKLGRPETVEIIAAVCRQYDVIALQEITSTRRDVLDRLMDVVNDSDGKFLHVIGPRLGRTQHKEQFAFIYNSARVEIDPQSVYTIDDPDDRLHREPLVAGFRARGPSEDTAFTFTLINVHTDPDDVDGELEALADVYRAVQRDGREEDDVIMLGDFNADEESLVARTRLPGITAAVYGLPTNTRRTEAYDNFLLSERATAEFLGRAGVFDLVREFNITEDQALAVSDHFPVWAEFSSVEGGKDAAVADVPAERR
jgi:endonuclease/exonuclease/phosphatase family metal-dependent hydrolase